MKELLISLAANPQIALALLSGVAWLLTQAITSAYAAFQKSALSKNALAAQAVDLAERLALSAVTATEQAVRPQFSAEGLPLTTDGQAKCKAAALAALKGALVSNAAPAAKAILDQGELYLVQLIESAVAQLPKSTGTSVAPLKVAPSP